MPEPVIVNISDEFAETMERHENYEVASRSLGYNFGSTLQNGYQELLSGQPLNKDLQSRLLDLFAFDVLIGNTDRRGDKPNFLTNGEDLLIFDHELAFSFTQQLPFARNPSPWLNLHRAKTWKPEQNSYQQLKGNSHNFANFVTRLSVINEAFWTKAWNLIPEDWRNEHFDVIREYLTRVIEHRNEFASELNRVLL